MPWAAAERAVGSFPPRAECGAEAPLVPAGAGGAGTTVGGTADGGAAPGVEITGAALDDVLARFTPKELEKRLSDPSVLDSLLPMNRRAKQWDLFVERYEEVAGEARENFNVAFGKAFLKAYEAQVKQLRSTSRHRRSAS